MTLQHSTLNQDGSWKSRKVFVHYNFTDFADGDSLYKTIVQSLDEDNYVYGLKYRELLFHLRESLTEFIQKLFRELHAKHLRTFTDYQVQQFCRFNHSEQRFPFKLIAKDVATFIGCFSPTLKNHPRYQHDVTILLEVCENFKPLAEIINYYSLATHVKRDRHLCYGHISQIGITLGQFRTVQYPIKVIERQLQTININSIIASCILPVRY